MRNIQKLVDDYRAKFEGTRSGADAKATELQQLYKLTEERAIFYNSLSIKGLMFCAFQIAWEAAYMAGYKRAINEGKKKGAR